MYTYTIQHAKPSGEAFALEYLPDNTIHATCGPLHWSEVDRAKDDPSILADWNYDFPGDGFEQHTDWGFPVVSYDPSDA